MNAAQEFDVYRALFAASPDGLLLVDADGRIVMANPAVGHLLGYSIEELTRLSVDALVPDAIRARHAEHRGDYAAQPRSRPMGTSAELAARRRDGSLVMVEIALSPLVTNGRALVVATMRDVGAYPRVRQALQRARYGECVAEVGRFAVDVRDVQLLMREIPGSALRALQADQAVLYLLEPSGAECHVAARAGLARIEPEGVRLPIRAETPWGFAFSRGEPTVVDDYRLEKRFSVPASYLDSGLLSAVAAPLGSRGRTVGLLAVRARRAGRFGRDEVQFVQSLANLLASSLQRAESEEALAHAQRLESIGQLSGGIAHDFNNLLTVILGNMQVLDDLPSMQDETARELVAAATRAGRRGAELTTKLLAFSRRQLLQPVRVDVSALVESLAAMLRRTLDQRIVIATEIPPQPAFALADTAQLESALLNLAINARDAMPDGGSITLGVRPDGQWVTLWVADTGAGMPEAVRQRAFEPFFTTKEKGRGTGLGLSSVYGFVTQSRGTVDLDSAPGRGTTVTLRIPCWHDTPSAAATAADRGRALPDGLRVLLVEDDAEVRKVVAAFLRRLGATPTDRPDAEQALAALDAGLPFDLVLTDVALGPGLRGTDLAARLRQSRPDLPVVLMSGFASELLEAEQTLLQPGELLRKPFTRDELASAVLRALDAHAHGRMAP